MSVSSFVLIWPCHVLWCSHRSERPRWLWKVQVIHISGWQQKNTDSPTTKSEQDAPLMQLTLFKNMLGYLLWKYLLSNALSVLEKLDDVRSPQRKHANKDRKRKRCSKHIEPKLSVSIDILLVKFKVPNFAELFPCIFDAYHTPTQPILPWLELESHSETDLT